MPEAKFSQSNNDLHWSLYAGDDGTIRWTGYDDRYWWENVSPTDLARKRVGKVTGRTFVLNHETKHVTIFD